VIGSCLVYPGGGGQGLAKDKTRVVFGIRSGCSLQLTPGLSSVNAGVHAGGVAV